MISILPDLGLRGRDRIRQDHPTYTVSPMNSVRPFALEADFVDPKFKGKVMVPYGACTSHFTSVFNGEVLARGGLHCEWPDRMYSAQACRSCVWSPSSGWEVAEQAMARPWQGHGKGISGRHGLTVWIQLDI